MKIEKEKELKNLTTFRIGGKAEFFIDAQSSEEAIKAVAWTKEKGVNVSILGGGSNVLVSDAGVKGLVLKVSIPGIEIIEENEMFVLVKAGAGVNWDEFVNWSVENDLWGIENLSFIPGNVGASPVQNIGAYGTEAKDTIEGVVVLDTNDLQIKNLSNSECEFGYRTSVFKKLPGRYIVLETVFKLGKNGLPNLSYPDLQKIDEENINLHKIRQAVIEIRQNKLPDVRELGTAGSFFKNPEVSFDELEKLKNKFVELPAFPADNGKYKVSLGWIIDHVCNMKGYQKGNVGTYPKQALALVNYGGGMSSEIEDLAREIESAVKKETGLEIDWEVTRL